MFKLLSSSKVGITFITGALVLTSMSVQAELTPYNSNGVDLVYSSVSDVSWTKDANLLSSLFASKGFNTIVNAIIAASPTITNTSNLFSTSGTYTITASDFYSNGRTSWFGAMAYVNYLNSISYGGVNNWVLPTIATEAFSYNSPTNGIIKGDEFAELFGGELSGAWFYLLLDEPYVPSFDNEQFYAYWTGTEVAPGSNSAWYFDTSNGFQFSLNKSVQFYAWAVSPGQIMAVPEPQSAAMLLAGLGLVSLFSHSRKTNK